jgi:flagellar hook-associated protein 1
VANISTLYTGLSGIRAAQVGIDTTGHNIANVNTRGFTRQRVLQSALPPFQHPAGPVGTGVGIDGMERMRDAFLDARARASTAGAAFEGVRADLLGRLESITGEPDAGISSELDKLWDAFDTLAMEPESSAARVQVIGALDSLSSRIRGVATAWSRLGEDTAVRQQAAAAELDGALGSVAQMDLLIMNNDGRPIPPDLLDRRDMLLDRISELTGATATIAPNGAARVVLGDTVLLEDATAAAITVDDTQGVLVDGAPTAVLGELGGLTQFLLTDLPAQQQRLDAVVGSIADTLNTQHAAARVHPTGAAGAPLLEYDGTAASLRRAIGSIADLATAGPGPGPTDRFDGTGAGALANLRTTVPAGETTTLADAWRTVVVDLGATVANTTRDATALSDIASAANSSRESMHGVSIDEEMIHLIEYQRALEAASRVLTTVDEALDVLVNRTGIVGR